MTLTSTPKLVALAGSVCEVGGVPAGVATGRGRADVRDRGRTRMYCPQAPHSVFFHRYRQIMYTAVLNLVLDYDLNIVIE